MAGADSEIVNGFQTATFRVKNCAKKTDIRSAASNILLPPLFKQFLPHPTTNQKPTTHNLQLITNSYGFYAARSPLRF